MCADARLLKPADLHIGLTYEFDRDVTEDDILTFARLSGDANPLHVDPTYAASTNYQARIAHGAFQVGLASAMLGMFLPGRRVLLMSVQSRFPTPLFFPAPVRVRGTISSWSESRLRGVLKVVVADSRSAATTAEIFMGFTFHDQAERGPTDDAPGSQGTPERTRHTDRPLVMVTGAGGGLGGALALALANEYDVLAITNRRPLGETLRAEPNVHETSVDLGQPGWEGTLDDVRGDRPLYAIVHAAWPGAPQGGLLSVSDEAIEQQVVFGAAHTIRLARYLAASVDTSGRLVAIGSVYATAHPSVSLGAYSLGKTIVEHTIRLLATELARKQITANVVSPSVVATGMNAHLNDRQRLRETAQIPMGRLCTPDDVATLVRYLLSPAAGFVSGQDIVLAGGQL